MLKRQLPTPLKTLLFLSIVLSVSACGFHLRGNIPLPSGIQNMYVEAPAGTFKDQLEEVLTNGGAQLASAPAGADVILNVRKAATNRTVGTLDERAKASSYNLRFRVSYTLDTLDKKQLRKATLVETRRYNFDPELVIESEAEEAELQQDMEQAIALRMMRQLSTVTDLQ
ncbi:MAG: hypothetical protein HKN50_01885 [Gammaproteobacteria bacterium]|nr:hypothetical protein [Gammaproteobacteria bacterium]